LISRQPSDAGSTLNLHLRFHCVVIGGEFDSAAAGWQKPLRKRAQQPPAQRSEERYWRSHFDRERYYHARMSYDDCAPAYRIAGEACGRYGNTSFEDVEHKLANDYRRARGGSRA
jgi:hypothetical protein